MIEQTLQDLTAAIQALAEAMNENTKALHGVELMTAELRESDQAEEPVTKDKQAAAAAAAEAEKKAKADAAEKAEAEKAKKEKAAAAKKSDPHPTTEDSDAPTQIDVRRKLAALPRDTAMEILRSVGAAKLSEVPAEKYTDVIRVAREAAEAAG